MHAIQTYQSLKELHAYEHTFLSVKQFGEESEIQQFPRQYTEFHDEDFQYRNSGNMSFLSQHTNTNSGYESIGFMPRIVRNLE